MPAWPPRTARSGPLRFSMRCAQAGSTPSTCSCTARPPLTRPSSFGTRTATRRRSSLPSTPPTPTSRAASPPSPAPARLRPSLRTKMARRTASAPMRPGTCQTRCRSGATVGGSTLRAGGRSWARCPGVRRRCTRSSRRCCARSILRRPRTTHSPRRSCRGWTRRGGSPRSCWETRGTPGGLAASATPRRPSSGSPAPEIGAGRGGCCPGEAGCVSRWSRGRTSLGGCTEE
mmetsp:Transcript_42133/g.138641  ORF Transcript_42133/g.138641 Transcript_42133/m.138641 type:complete len:231 (+) Transcript_42133:678-1370(+)